MTVISPQGLIQLCKGFLLGLSMGGLYLGGAYKRHKKPYQNGPIRNKLRLTYSINKIGFPINIGL